MFTRTKAPMSMPRRSALPRVALLALTLASVTCSDPGSDFGDGMITGTVYLSEPVEGATVTLNRWDDGIIGAEVCRATTDATGSFACASGKFFGIMLVTATGGHTVEQGAELTLPAGSVLRAPLIDLEPTQQRTVHMNPATDLIVALGRARFAASQDESFAASVARAHALLRTHLDADPVTVAPKAINAPTAFDESARVALVLRGLGEYAHAAAVDQGVTVQAVNTRALLDQLVKDATSAEVRFDGNASEVLSIGPNCALPSGCTAEGPGCYASCSIYSNSLRSRLAAACLAWLSTPANRTGLGADDILTWATAITNNSEEQLFSGDPPEVIDELGPAITWVSPAAGQVFTTGTIAIDVTAADPLGVASLSVVHVVGQTRVAITDTDPTPERFIGALPLSPTLAEGPLVLEAAAADRDGNASTVARTVEVNQLAGGAISGVAIKAALATAPVTVRSFAGGAAGATITTGTTDVSGNFTNLTIPEGTQGPLLVEVGGGGTYAEDAQPATVVSLAATEKLSVILPSYVDGDTVTGLVVSPATTLSVAYLTYLLGANQGGADLAAKWTTATAAIERHLGVTGLTTVVPSVPSQVDSLDDADRYGLVLLALSRTAWSASTLGGGDAGAFGSSVNAMKVLQVWVRDLGDGCLDGKAGPTPLTYGGPTPLTDEATRLQLAQALVAYLGSAQNQTQFHAAADVLPLLDTLATGGGNAAPGACPGTNHLFDDDGASFDREGPVVTWGAFPATDPYVRGMVTVTASAIDNLPDLPSLLFTTGQIDIDVAPNAVRAILDTTGMNGPVPLAVRAEDGSMNATTATHDLIADNLAPVVTITSPATNGLFLPPSVTLDWSVVEANPMATMATLDGATAVSPGFQVAAEGAHALTVTATDRAGGSASATRTFTIDSTPPLISSVAAPSGAVVKPPLTITATATDNLMAMGSLGTDIAVASAPTPTTTTPGTSGGNRTLAVTYAALADGPFTVRFNIADRAGNAAIEHSVTRTIDGTAPTLTWPMTLIGADYWTTTATPTLTGTVTDANLASVIVSWPGGSVAATAAGGTWTATVPAGANLDLVGKDLTVTAADLAGNTTAITRRLRADVTPPVVGFIDELIRDESKDAIAFDPSVDATYGKPKLNPSHTHSTTAPNTTTLGPDVACTLGTTPVTKYAYLLDETPLYGSHANDPVVDGDNALRWTVAPSDDGVGLTSTRYRVVNVATSAVLLDWTTLPTTATTTVPLRRVGVTSPSIPLLGTTQGLLRIEFEVTDQLNRITTATRCWDQRLLAAPIYLGGAATLPVTDAAANAAGQYSLAGLTLDSTAPAMPVSMMMTANALGGAGLFEFPIYNPTNETIYLSIDLDQPSGATWNKTYYNNKWVYRDVATNTNCGSTGSTGEWEPDIDLPGCGLSNPTGGTPGSQMGSGTVPQSDYGIRIWTGNQISTTLTELTQCPGCSTTPAAAQRTRITVQLPPRGTGANPPPPVEVQILPVLRPNATNYQPAGSATEFNVAGTPTSFTLTGAATATATRCLAWNLPVPYTGATAPTYRCTSTRNFTQVRYLKSVSVAGLLGITASAFTGLGGSAISQPAHLLGLSNTKSYVPPNPVWNTSELAEPPAL